MLVMKFGGSSVANAGQIDKVLRIVQGRQHRRPLVVCSAHKGVTDALISAAHQAAAGRPDLGPIVERHQKILADIGAEPTLLDPYFKELDDLLRGISLVREVSPRVLDYVQGFGERLSVRNIAHYFNRQGVPAEPFDAWDLGFITDANFGAARPIKAHENLVKAAVLEKLRADVVPIVTGFIGKTVDGANTTVGRNGSDFSATVFAAALDAEECEIWTDTDGVMTSDPNLVPTAKNIPSMSFAEASELAYYGGRVLHPSTLLPAVKKNIPVRVLNTNQPSHPGTVITENGGAALGPVTSIAYKTNQQVVTIESTLMLGQPGFLARVFEVFGRHQVDIDMVSTSEVSVSMTTAPRDLSRVVDELTPHGRVTVAQKKSVLSIVGRNLKRQKGLGGIIFGALGRADVNVEMISLGASNINMSLILDDEDIRRAVPALHTALFE